MGDLQQQPDTAFHKMLALVAIAFELKYGMIDKQLTLMAGQGDLASGEHLEDEIKELAEQIGQLKGQVARMEEKLQTIKELTPKRLAAVGSDSNTICPDSDPRKAECFRLWEDPIIVIEDWLHLSQSFSEKEKDSFAERMISMLETYDLSELSFSGIYPNSTL